MGNYQPFIQTAVGLNLLTFLLFRVSALGLLSPGGPKVIFKLEIEVSLPAPKFLCLVKSDMPGTIVHQDKIALPRFLGEGLQGTQSGCGGCLGTSEAERLPPGSPALPPRSAEYSPGGNRLSHLSEWKDGYASFMELPGRAPPPHRPTPCPECLMQGSKDPRGRA